VGLSLGFGFGSGAGVVVGVAFVDVCVVVDMVEVCGISVDAGGGAFVGAGPG